MRRVRRWLRLICSVAVSCAVALLVGVPSAQARTSSCRDIAVPANVIGQRLTMHGVLCPARGVPLHMVQVLVPGASYSHIYWDFPYRPERYNFRRAMNSAGFDTLTIDRVGTGQSSRPLSATVTVDLQAEVIHEVVQALRRGDLGDAPARKVILGGHSLGSVIAIGEASVYHDVDGVLLTGFSHHLDYTTVARLLAVSFRPAFLDPRLASRGYDPGYLTTQTGTRAEFFYSPGIVEPEVAHIDEATKDVFSTTEAPGVVTSSLPESRNINVPVLLANGALDPIVCGAGADCSSATSLRSSEGPYFASAARLQTYVLPEFGHDINLAADTSRYQDAVIEWARGVAMRNDRKTT